MPAIISLKLDVGKGFERVHRTVVFNTECRERSGWCRGDTTPLVVIAAMNLDCGGAVDTRLDLATAVVVDEKCAIGEKDVVATTGVLLNPRL